MDNPRGTYLYSWAYQMLRYVSKGRKVFICPVDKPLEDRNNLARAASWHFDPYEYSYGANYWVMGNQGSIEVTEDWEVPFSRIIFVAECNWSWFSNQMESSTGQWAQATWDRDYIDWRHPAPSVPGSTGTRDGAANFLFVDGHTKWLKKYVDEKKYYIAPPGGNFSGWFGAED